MKRLAVILGGLLAIGLLFSACTKKDSRPTVWIYTSIYKNVISEFEPLLRNKFPGVKVEWFQAGSENVAARLNAELSSGQSQADLVLTSDPFWYLELKKAGQLLPHESPAANRVPDVFRDSDHAFITVRMCVAVMGHHTMKESAHGTPKGWPKSWTDLTDPVWKGLVSMGSPLESGTAMLLTAQLVRKYGWDYFKKMRANDLLAAGGNSAVVSRMETRERPVGMLLLENLLEAKKKESPLEIVYPEDGAVLVPSPMAILKTSKQPELAKQIYDYLLSDEAQKAFLRGRMYSPIPHIGEPEGAKPFAEVWKTALEWSPKVLEELYAQRQDYQRKFTETVLQ